MRLNQVNPISSTWWLIVSGEAFRLRSMISPRPPGFNTRHISLSAPTGSAKFLNAARHSRKSKLSFWSGILEAEPCLKSTRTPASAAFLARHFHKCAAQIEPGDGIGSKVRQLNTEVPWPRRNLENRTPLRDLACNPARKVNVFLHHFGCVGRIPFRDHPFHSPVCMGLAHCKSRHDFSSVSNTVIGFRN